MNRRGLVVLAVACVVVAGVAAWVSYAQTPAPSTAPAGELLNYLGVPAGEQPKLAATDEAFAADAARLRAAVTEAQAELARRLEASAPEAEILAQVDVVADAQRALARRVAQYVVRLRAQLTPQQQQRLMGLCARGVRGGIGPRWMGEGEHGMGGGGGGGPGWQGGRGMGGPGNGRGMGGGGMGRGMGHGEH